MLSIICVLLLSLYADGHEEKVALHMNCQVRWLSETVVCVPSFSPACSASFHQLMALSPHLGILPGLL